MKSFLETLSFFMNSEFRNISLRYSLRCIKLSDQLATANLRTATVLTPKQKVTKIYE